MKCIFRRILQGAGTLLLAVVILTQPIWAAWPAIPATISFEITGKNMVGRTDKVRTAALYTGTGAGVYNMSSQVSNAVTKWGLNNLPTQIVTNTSDAYILFWVDSQSELYKKQPAVTIYHYGLTVTKATKVGTTKFGAITVDVYNLPSQTLCYINTDLNPQSSNQAIHTVLHEYTHALGYMNHSKNTNDLMYEWEPSNIVNLMNYDINQVKQMYP